MELLKCEGGTVALHAASHLLPHDPVTLVPRGKGGQAAAVALDVVPRGGVLLPAVAQVLLVGRQAGVLGQQGGLRQAAAGGSGRSSRAVAQ